jgi:hypothetical protein
MESGKWNLQLLCIRLENYYSQKGYTVTDKKD